MKEQIIAMLNQMDEKQIRHVFFFICGMLGMNC